MADVLTKEQRHRNMQRIRSKDTKPERCLRKALWNKGYRYRKNYKKLPGKPDIVLTKHKICVFIDSEFFHGKGFISGFEGKKYKSLKDRLEHSEHSEFWLRKIQRNMERDREVDAELLGLGWHVIRFWSKEALKETDNCVRAIEEIIFQRETEDRN